MYNQSLLVFVSFRNCADCHFLGFISVFFGNFARFISLYKHFEKMRPFFVVFFFFFVCFSFFFFYEQIM